MGKKIKSALISVYYKDGLDQLVHLLNQQGVVIYSTGGTQDYIEQLGIPVKRVEDLTAYPSILGGRVKTLHPKVFGGILGRRSMQGDLEQMSQFEIPEIDLVIVDLYPFEETVASGASHAEIIEKIDIGGISLIRAAAKNYTDVCILSSKGQYKRAYDILVANDCSTELADRMHFAVEAFACSSDYDTHIFKYMNAQNTGSKVRAFKQSEMTHTVLRYGENPHQEGVFYGDLNALFDQLGGKELSYNNLLDVDAAVNLIDEFEGAEPTFAILKHNNACGIAVRTKLVDAYRDALAGDPISAFGGILICNCPVDKETAMLIDDLFCEVLIAPDFAEEALPILQSKKNRIILKRKKITLSGRQFRSALNGVLEQDKDFKKEVSEDLVVKTKRAPSAECIKDLLFANKLVKHTKSNTIVLAKGGQLLASGTGQTSRVDALRQAIVKAQAFGFDLNGAVMASDAFFPFPDCVEIADQVGIKDVIQPGGSIKDELSIQYCDEHGMSMVFTGNRHFKH